MLVAVLLALAIGGILNRISAPLRCYMLIGMYASMGLLCLLVCWGLSVWMWPRSLFDRFLLLLFVVMVFL